MSNSINTEHAQLDKAEREDIEDVVADMRERVEDNIRFQLVQAGLEDHPQETEPRSSDVGDIITAIELEGGDDSSWSEAFDEYVASVGYTIVNRLAALRCMEARGFLDEEVTQFKPSGLTPAAETLVQEEFLLEDEAILRAYQDICDELADEIEILFDRSSANSLIDPEKGVFEELCGMMNSLNGRVWRAEDVLGWVYEYYNRPIVEAIDAKNALDPEDIGPANQFYTPHWVVRMLTDNSLGKLYVEGTGQENAIPSRNALSPTERKERLVTPADAPGIPELCTYLIPNKHSGEAPQFDHPRELRVIDPACGSGHFLLYAFDILERIWWAETDVDRTDIPEKILQYNLYGVDIDLRSCQLSAFNLYLKARTRTEAEGGRFDMPNVGIVCADASVAEVQEATEILDELTGEGSDLQAALRTVIDRFQRTEALGSLLNVSGTLESAFDASKSQSELTDFSEGAYKSLNSFLKALREAVAQGTSGSFGERNLKSFLHLLVVLTQEYDVSLMNPPYGSGGRMPNEVQGYVEENYEYTTEYYVNFIEAGHRMVRENGRVGMLVPRSFMFKHSFKEFREDFIGGLGSFDFLAELGIGLLDNATVRNAGAVVRVGNPQNEDSTGEFVRLHDVDTGQKESVFLDAGFGNKLSDGVQRWYSRDLSEFSLIPGSPISYWVPKSLRSIYDSDMLLDSENAGVDRDDIGVVKQGLATADDDRFLRRFWEAESDDWVPFAKGGEDAWILPRIPLMVNWEGNGEEIKRYGGSRPQNIQHYFKSGLTYTAKKENCRRFGYLPKGSIFAHIGSAVLPSRGVWQSLTYTTSTLGMYLMLCQTPDRSWEVGNVAKLPFKEFLLDSKELESKAKGIAGALIAERQSEFRSPYYTAPSLLKQVSGGESLPTHDGHAHRRLMDELPVPEPKNGLGPSATLQQIGAAAAQYRARILNIKLAYEDDINRSIFEQFEISEKLQKTILQEIALRTNQDPRKSEMIDIDSVTGNRENLADQVKDLLLHFALDIVGKSEDGIIPTQAGEGKDDLHDKIIAQFKQIWGEHAQQRLAEVDELLGDKSAGSRAYPNLRSWLENDLFEYHISKFDRTPILWRITTERLVSDQKGVGFSCLIDYHQLDRGVFDRLSNNYLEQRKGTLRERLSAAKRQQADNSSTASERAETAEKIEQIESALEQITIFEDRLAKLFQPSPGRQPIDDRKNATKMAERTSTFRRQTQDRIKIVDELAGMSNVSMKDLFTANFYQKVEDNRVEWVRGLEALETAFRAYSSETGHPVEAHLYDLFDYYTEDLLGSSHFASSGVLYLTYYFKKFEELDQNRLDGAGVSHRQQLISNLAEGLEDYIELGEAIAHDCGELKSTIPSNWADRALAEVTAAGYKPVHKHGVKINITPLAEAEIVPKVVDDRVI